MEDIRKRFVLQIDTSRKMQSCIIAMLFILIVSYTGGKSLALNTAFIVLSIVATLFSNAEFGYALFAGATVYFGYSYIELNNYISSSLGNSTYLYILCLSILVRGAIKRELYSFRKKHWGVIFLVFSFWYAIVKIPVSPLTAFGTFAQCLLIGQIIIKFEEDSEGFSYFTKSLVIALLSTFIYVALWRDLLNYDLSRGYCGVRDSNNFSFLCNLCIVFLYRSEIQWKKVMSWILAFCTLITISMSGILSLLAIGLIISTLSNEKKKSISKIIAIILAVCVIALSPLLLNLLSSVGGTLGAVANRISSVFSSVQQGDYQTATTNRTMLWTYYMNQYNDMSLLGRLFGSQRILRLTQTSYYASHNTFIDLLTGSGFLGLSLFLIIYVLRTRELIRMHDYQMFAFSLVFLLNLAFRTFSGFSMFTPIIL